MKQKRTRDLTEKTENDSERNAPAQREDAFCPKAPSENGSIGNAQAQEGKRICPKAPTENVSRGETEEGLTGGSHMSGLNLAGARRLRWSPASNHGETGRSECTKSFSVSFRVGGWWTWASGSTTSTATLSPADGGSGDGGELRWCAANFELKRGSEGGMH